MTIDVKTWTIQHLRDAKTNGTLVIDPEYQRREVWKLKAKMLLVDSLARDVPIGAITLYADNPNGYDVFEVIDGKQRVSSLLSFEDDEFVINTEMIASSSVDDDEFDLENDAIVSEFHNRKFSELDPPTRIKFGQYEIPVFVVRGSRADAIRAFTRMNGSNYALKPQEIRNAFFAGSQFLKAVIALCENVNQLTSDSSSFFMAVGAITKTAFDRMQDIQLASELLGLLLRGPQNRRDTLDKLYEEFRTPTPLVQKELVESSAELLAILTQIWTLFGGSQLAAYHFHNVENDLYGLVGAIHAHGRLTKPQIDAGIGAEFVEVLKGFFARVQEYRQNVLHPADPMPGFEDDEEEYGRGYFSGQINSLTRRQKRIEIIKRILDGVVATLDPQSQFSPEQRRLIWARSIDKACGRCGQPVEWRDYNAGHVIPHAQGGATIIDNGRVEHARCNQSAGAS